MEKISISEIVEATKGTLVGRGLVESVKNISIDSRSLRKGDFFIPLKGENFDGHKFITEACKKGICGFLFSESDAFAPDLIAKKYLNGILVKDTTKALQDIAMYYRNKYNLKVACVTGSNGKTTTKDILGTMLSSEKVLVTEGNKNNHIGVPLMLLKLKSRIKKAVLELGMNHSGEIRRLTQLASPDVAVVTNIGYAHMEFFKSLDEVAKAKLEITEHLKEDGVLIVNGDDEVLMRNLKKYKGKVITFGLKSANDVYAKDIKADAEKISFTIKDGKAKKSFKVSVELIGKHNVYNVLAAFCAASSMGVDTDVILSSLDNLTISDNRMRKQTVKGITMINDAYNANPTSTAAAITALTDMEVKGKKIFVFADMKELGKISKKAHAEIGEKVAKAGIDFFVTFGDLAKEAAVSALKNKMPEENVVSVNTQKEAASALMRILDKGDSVLLKGSRVMKLEQIEKYLFDLMTEKKSQNKGVLV